MDGFDPTLYGDRMAEIYDVLETPNLETDAAVERLASIADGGRILELGVGTGRLALPLAARGLEVDGVECSSAMLETLRAKPGADRIGIIEGDFASVELPTGYSLVFAAYNTLCALPDQETQVQCLTRVAAALSDGGAVVLEVSMPDAARLAKRRDIWLRHVDERLAVFHSASFDPVAQTVVGQYMLVTDRGVRTYPVRSRYVWPCELDLMAGYAGLQRAAWWSGWRRERFDARSETLVALYRRPATSA